MVELRPRTSKGAVAKTDAEEILRDINAETSVAGAPATPSEMPLALQFPQMVALSLALSSLGYSLLARAAPGELVGTWKALDTWGDVALFTGWRM